MTSKKAAPKKVKAASQMQRVDAGFSAYLTARAKKEDCTVVEVTRKMLAAIKPAKKGGAK